MNDTSSDIGDSKLIKSCSRDIIDARKSLVLRHRMHSLSVVYGTDEAPTEFLVPKDPFNNRLFGLCEVKTATEISSIQEVAPFFGTFIHNNPGVLLKALLTRVANPDFQVIVKIAIPEVYGFFSCEEMIDNAFLFYEMVISEVQPVLAVDILEPFFVSLVTAKASEMAFSNFIRTCDITTCDDLNDAATILLSCLRDSLKYLPTCHLVLAAKLGLKKRECAVELLFVRMFGRAWMEFVARVASKRNRATLRNVFDKCRSLITNEFCTELSALSSEFHPPRLYRCFHGKKGEFLDVLVCVSNLYLLAKMFDEAKCLPDSFTMEEFVVPSELRFSHFWTEVFPDTPAATHTTPFTNPKERLVSLRVFLRVAQSANESSTYYLSKQMARPLQELANEYRPRMNFMKFFASASSQFVIDTLKQVLYLFLLEKALDGNVLVSAITHLNPPFAKLLECTGNEDGRCQQITTTISTQFRGSNIFRLPDTFFTLMQVADIIDKLHHGNHCQIFRHVIRAMRFNNFIFSYVVLKSCAFKHPVFASLCTSHQHRLWHNITEAVETLLATDKMLSEALKVTESNLADQFESPMYVL